MFWTILHQCNFVQSCLPLLPGLDNFTSMQFCPIVFAFVTWPGQFYIITILSNRVCLSYLVWTILHQCNFVQSSLFKLFYYILTLLFSCYITEKKAFKYELCGPVINLFCCHETIDLPGDTAGRLKNKLIFKMDVNFHQASMKEFFKQGFLTKVQDGSADLNQSDMKVFIHSIDDKQTEKTPKREILSINDVEIAKDQKRSIVHPNKVAIPVDKARYNYQPVPAGLSTRGGQQSESVKRLLSTSIQHQEIFYFLEKFNYKKLSTIDDLKSLATDIDMPIDYMRGDFKVAYQTFRQKFQEKFRLFFSMLDGNHRSSIIAKILDEECFSDAYYKPENWESLMMEDRTNLSKIYDLYTVEVEYHPTILIPMKIAKRESSKRRQSIQKLFGEKFLDYFSMFGKHALNSNLEQCDDDNFFCHNHSTDIHDAFTRNYGKMIEYMILTMVGAELDIVEDDYEKLIQCGKENSSSVPFIPFFGYTNLDRNVKQHKFPTTQVHLPQEQLIILELMRLFLGNIQLLPKFNYFLQNTYITEDYRNTTEHHSKINFQFFKSLLQTIHVCTDVLYKQLMHEMAILKRIKRNEETGVWDQKEFSDMKNNFPSNRWHTFIAINQLEDIINVWSVIGNDPQPFFKPIEKYGSQAFFEKMRSEIRSNNKIESFLIHLLVEYEYQYKSYVNWAFNENKNVFELGWKKRMVAIYKNKAKKLAMTDYPQNDKKVPGHVFRLRDLHDENDDEQLKLSVLVPCTFRTFMSLYYPCLKTNEDKNSLRKYDYVLIDANVPHPSKGMMKIGKSNLRIRKYHKTMTMTDDIDLSKSKGYDNSDDKSDKSTSAKRRNTGSKNSAKKPKKKDSDSRSTKSNDNKRGSTDTKGSGQKAKKKKNSTSTIQSNPLITTPPILPTPSPETFHTPNITPRAKTRSQTKKEDSTPASRTRSQTKKIKESALSLDIIMKDKNDDGNSSDSSNNEDSSYRDDTGTENSTVKKSLHGRWEVGKMDDTTITLKKSKEKCDGTLSTMSTEIGKSWYNPIVIQDIQSCKEDMDKEMRDILNTIDETNVMSYEDRKKKVEHGLEFCMRRIGTLSEAAQMWQNNMDRIVASEEKVQVSQDMYNSMQAFMKKLTITTDNADETECVGKTETHKEEKLTKNSAGTFDSVECEECTDKIPTNHRCMHELSEGGYLCEDKRICGKAICGICKSSRNCTLNRCKEHNVEDNNF